jgi:hypothetical protein
MSYGPEMCSSFGARTKVGWEWGGQVELSVLSDVTYSTMSAEFHFNNTGLFTILPVIFMHHRAHVLLNNLHFFQALLLHNN